MHAIEPVIHAPGTQLGEPYGAAARIGLIVLSTDPVIERDFHRLVPDDGIGVFSTRIHLETPNSDRTFLALADWLEAAARLLIPDSRLDAIVFGCTSASTLIGPRQVEQRIRLGRPGVAVTNPATATVAALRALKARRVALITPYTAQMTRNVMRFLAEADIELSSVRIADHDTDHAIGSIPERFFVEAAQASQLAGADAIFISCTGTRALNVIEEIEAQTGLPVVVSNQAAFWHALRLAGREVPIRGYGRLLIGVDRYMDTVIELTRALIAQDTSDPPGNEARAARVIAEALRAGGIEPHVYEVAPGRTNLVARIRGAGRRPSLAFSAHFDTIGVDPGQWRVDPFAGEIRDGRLHGRGSTDMKGGMAAMTIAALELQRDAARLQGDLLLTFSAAENSNCLGARRLLADGHFVGVGALLISEPTGNRAFVTEKGALWIRATAHGEYGHNAFSEHRGGDRGNAIVRLARYLDQAHDLRLAAPAHRHVGAPTINIGTIRGGLSTPLIPAQASADIDVRLVPGQSPESVIEAFRAIAGPHIEIEALDLKLPVDTPDEHPFVAQCVEACRAEGVSDPGPAGVGYYSDGAVIAPPLDLPMVIIGPGEVGMSGAVDEYVEIDKLETSVRIFERVARAYLE